MIDRIDMDNILTDYTLALKLNEVIDALNSRAVLEETGHPEVAEAAKKAVRTGTHADLKIWLDLRRKYYL